MPRIGILNILIGFLAIILASLGGFFLASDADKAFLMDKSLLHSWEYTLFRSAHAHCNLFGMLHILFGLSLPYSQLSQIFYRLQSFGLLLGTLTMGFLLVLRGLSGLPEGRDLLGILIGVNLMASVCALISHCYGLSLKMLRRN